jgi:hypothetical protein
MRCANKIAYRDDNEPSAMTPYRRRRREKRQQQNGFVKIV